MADLGAFTADFASLRKIMAAGNSSQPAVRWKLFATAAAGAARCVSRGLSRADAAEALLDIAHNNGLVDDDAIQDILAEAFEDAINVVPLPLDEPHQNGKRHSPPPATQIPVIYPFPINGKGLPRRPWLVPGLLLRRCVTLLVAPPGIGKSLLTLQIGLLCCSGMAQWGGWKPRGVFRVLIINIEEDHTEMERRLSAAALQMGMDQNNLSNIGIAQTEQTESIVVAKADSRTKTVVATPMLDRIIATIIAQNIDIVVVDPFAETFAGDENSNSELKWAAVLWRAVARKTNAAVMLVHHAKKYAQNMAGDPDAGRGGGALAGVARIVATLFNMTEKEAESFHIDPEHRTKYIRFDDAKANLSLVSAFAKWFEKKSISIENAGEGEPADDVGVLAPWRPPDVFADMTAGEARGILDRLDEGVKDQDGRPTGDPYCRTRSGKAERWAGGVIIEFLQCSKDDAKTVIDKWIKNEVLIEYEAPVTTSKGMPRGCLRVNHSKRPGTVTEEVFL